MGFFLAALTKSVHSPSTSTPTAPLDADSEGEEEAALAALEDVSHLVHSFVQTFLCVPLQSCLHIRVRISCLSFTQEKRWREAYSDGNCVQHRQRMIKEKLSRGQDVLHPESGDTAFPVTEEGGKVLDCFNLR